MDATARGWRRSAVLAVFAVFGLAGCESSTDVPTEPPSDVAFAKTGSGQLPPLAKAVRQATARFHSTDQALQAGYTPDPHCVEVPGLGGMGYHWANFGLVDPVFDPRKPEVVLYEAGPDGTLHLVAVEYIVVDIGQPAPTFDGQAFDVNGAPLPFPHWALHVWLHKDNPNGLFTPFNPAVVCP